MHKKGELMKVYIVEQGEYSDRHIVAVFSEKEQADLYKAARNDSEREADDYVEVYDIYEFEVDETHLEGTIHYAIKGHIYDDESIYFETYITSVKSIKPELNEIKHPNRTDILDMIVAKTKKYEFIIPVPDEVKYDKNWFLVITDKNKKVVYDTIAKLKAEQEGI